MDIITLATTAMAILSPYLSKAGEGIAKKVGEDLWQLIKKPFTSDNDKEVMAHLDTPERQFTFQSALIQKFNEDPHYMAEVIALVENAQKQLASYQQQNVHNNAPIEKQVNIGNNSGNLNF